MGLGDWLLTAGEAARRAAGTKKKYRILDKRGQQHWEWIFEGHPNIARIGERSEADIGFVNGHRMYIVDETKERRTFCEYQPYPAPLKLTARAQELAKLAKGAVVFHPAIKRRASPNKSWGEERWQHLIDIGKGVRWLQIGEPGVPRIRGADHVLTPDFRDAIGLLSGARAAVLHEGALHHAAAAVSTPTVVIFGGYISPRVTGYDGQVSLYMEDERWPLGCGMRVPCQHCKDAMASITPERVAEALMKMLAGAEN